MAKDLTNPKRIPTRDSTDALLESGVGQFDNWFFRDGPDKSAVIVMFNGRNVHRTFETGGKIFNRWTWAERLRHPTFVLNDPEANNVSNLRLAWYLGIRGNWGLADLWRQADAMIDQVAPGAKRIVLGSSGGGFAAIQSLLKGHASLAFVINPQTDVRLSPEYDCEKALAHYASGGELGEADLPVISVSEALKQRGTNGGQLIYAQNLSDGRHYRRHFLPFLKSVGEQRPYAPDITTILYDNPDQKHGSPDLDGTVALFGTPFANLLA
ncbi:hypothetical protein ASE85_16170 [Sphingobium sp. Leaf26]|nr:hypothetical protein ASE85_16170 [Sphingobium sp. Leaf26]